MNLESLPPAVIEPESGLSALSFAMILRAMLGPKGREVLLIVLIINHQTKGG